MSLNIKKILSALLASTVIASSAAVGVSAASAKTTRKTSSSTAALQETASVSEEPVYDFSPVPGAAASDKTGEFTTIGYKHTVYSLDDYVLALKRTYRTNEELKSALDAAAKTDVDYVDNTKSKYFPKIGDQGQVGSCVAWSCIYYQFTNAINKMLDREATDEHTFQPMFLYNIYDGCGMPRHIENLLFTTGCAPVSMVRDTQNYTNWNAEYEIWREAANYRMRDYICFATFGEAGTEVSSPDDSNLAAIKAALRDGDVLSYAGPIGDYKYENVIAAPGVDKDIVGDQIVTKCIGSGVANHMMTIVGYNDNIWVDHNKNGKVDGGELGALKIANQYGTGCHTNGCFWISYDTLNKKTTVEGAVNDAKRSIPILGPGKWVVTKAYGTSGIFLEYTINSDNRTDNYIEITAKRNSDGMTYTRKVTPYFYSDYKRASNQRLNYQGKTGFCDGSMVSDLNLVVEDLDSNNFNDYTWSVRLVDAGGDSSQTTFKEVKIVDDNTGKTYDVDAQFPISLNGADKTVSFKKYYNFSKLCLPDASSITVGNAQKFTFKTSNETFGSTPIKYTMTISQNGKKIFTKVHKASAVNKSAGSSVVKGSWTPSKTGKYTVTISSTDAAGNTAERSAEFTVNSQKLAVRSINIDKGKYVDMCDQIKITPQVTGGKGPYTYSYYYVKGGKTIKLAENTKSTFKTKTFGTNSGSYKFIVKVKDSEGTVAQATQYVVVTPASVSRLVYDISNVVPGKTVKVGAEVNYLPEGLSGLEYVYTSEKDGKTETLTKSGDKQALWSPKENGDYNITVKLLLNGKAIAQKTDKFSVGTKDIAGMKTINVNVVSHVKRETAESGYKLHYWNAAGKIGDSDCVSLNSTKEKYVGFWKNAQVFYQYVAYIPDDSVGYKFHIGTRWFPEGIEVDDGDPKTTNTVYVFNYDGDRAVYTNE